MKDDWVGFKNFTEDIFDHLSIPNTIYEADAETNFRRILSLAEIRTKQAHPHNPPQLPI